MDILKDKEHRDGDCYYVRLTWEPKITVSNEFKTVE
jgi:hypothetical protein